MLAALDPGWAAFIGAIVGFAATVIGTFITGWLTGKAAKRQEEGQKRATAILLQDDFWHFQSTLARALDKSCWWSTAQLLPPQATIEDRKTVWAACNSDDTNIVAGAQGWMDYLIQRRKAIGQATPALTELDDDTMVLAFCRLEQGRGALAKLAQRPFTDYRVSRVLLQLSQSGQERLIDLLNTGCDDLLRDETPRS